MPYLGRENSPRATRVTEGVAIRAESNVRTVVIWNGER